MRRLTGWRTCWSRRVRVRVQCVALLLARSVEAIVAMLAVLKTGAAYLPIDPGLPAARIGFMLDDAAPIAAITTAGLAVAAGRVMTWWSSMSTTPLSTPNPAPRLPAPAPDDIAHLIYTSGTTGVPEGGGRHPPQRDPAVRLLGCRPGAGAGTGVDAVSFLWLSTFRCGRSGVRCYVVGGWWWCPSRWRAPRMISMPYWSLNRSACLTQTPSAVAALLARGVGVGGVDGRRLRPVRPRWWIGGRRGG